jgi:SAM-dependent methyltransferase
MKCRHCRELVETLFIDLGTAPPSNAYVSKKMLKHFEKWLPLRVLVCEKCWLVQTEDFADATELFDSEYAYFSSMSIDWLKHIENYVKETLVRFKISNNSHVIEIASNDGYLLQYFKKDGIPCLGIEPTASTARVAREKGIEIIEDFFTKQLAEKLFKNEKSADLVIGNNVLAHVPDINDFVSGVFTILKPDGVASFEFPHLLQLINKKQFDTIYHEHFSYLSLTSVNIIFQKYNLEIFDVQKLHTHGGSLRVYVKKKSSKLHITTNEVTELMAEEIKMGLDKPNVYKGFQVKAENIKYDFINFLIDSKRNEKSVVGYGAAAKGNTLINYAGVKSDLISFIVDQSPGKQGKYTPGARIPIVDEKMIRETRPDYIVIFPWNIKTEITNQLSYVREWGCKFVTFIPTLTIF